MRIRISVVDPDPVISKVIGIWILYYLLKAGADLGNSENIKYLLDPLTDLKGEGKVKRNFCGKIH
jgi:hypothetical protein